MNRLSAGALAGLALAACSGSGLPGFGSPEPPSVSLQASDLPSGLHPCPQSGTIDQFLAQERGRDDVDFEQTQQAWRDLRAAGATAAFEQVFADTRSHCTGLFDSQRAPGARVAISLVAKFRSESAAVGVFRRGISGNVEPAQLTGRPDVTMGAGSGLGANALAVTPAGQSVYLAVWQRGAFYLLLNTVGLGAGEGRRAAEAMRARAG